MAKYDLAIIGSGPGGYVTAIRAAQWGMKTLVIEKDGFLGGTCLHVGCIPTKVLLHHAEIYDYFKNAKEFGIDVKEFALNWPAVLARKDRIVLKHSKGIEFLFKRSKVETRQGWGRWAGPGQVSIENAGKETEIVEATHIMVATGSGARSLPGVEIDGQTVLSNIEILKLPAVPKTLVIVGGGAVGVEFASIFNTFGTQVTLLEMLPKLVPIEDDEISAELERLLRKKGIQIFTEARVESVKKNEQGAIVSFKDKTGAIQSLDAERVLMAVGRYPKTEKCGLEKSKAKMERGFVHTGPYMETDEPRLYAIGDIVAGMPQLAHAASMEGITCVSKLVGKTMPPIEKTRIPNCTYCEPQVASIGLTERAAREAGYAVKIGKFPFLGNSKATILGHHDGFIKVVSDETHGEILGVHIIGPYATEIISEATATLQLEGTVDDLMSTVHAHPTVWEANREAVEAVRGLSIDA